MKQNTNIFDQYDEQQKEDSQKLKEVEEENDLNQIQNVLEYVIGFQNKDFVQQQLIIKHLPLLFRRAFDWDKQELIKIIYYNEAVKDHQNLNEQLTQQKINKIESLFKIFNEDFDQKELFFYQEILGDFLVEISNTENDNLIEHIKTLIEHNHELFLQEILNNQILCLLLKLLNSQTKQSLKIIGLKLIQILYVYFDTALIQGFIETQILFELQSSNQVIKFEALQTFFKIYSKLKKESYKEKFLTLLKKLSLETFADIKICIIKHMDICIEIFEFDFIKNFLLVQFLKNFNSKNRFIKEEAFLALGKVCFKLVQKEPSPFDEASSILKSILLFFEVPNLLSQIAEAQIKSVIQRNVVYFSDIIQIYPQETLMIQIRHYYQQITNLPQENCQQFKEIFSKELKRIMLQLDEFQKQDLMHLIDIGFLQEDQNNNSKSKLWEKILEDLHLILREIPQEKRTKYAEFYQGVLDNQQLNWRLKYILTENLEQVLSLFSQEITITVIISIVFQLCTDNCFEVRKNASKNMYQVFMMLKDNDQFLQIFENNIVALAEYKRFNIR